MFGDPMKDEALQRPIGPFCAEFTVGAKCLGARRRPFFQTCPPSQTKKHSLTQHHGASPAHLGIITRHLVKSDIMLLYWVVWGL